MSEGCQSDSTSSTDTENTGESHLQDECLQPNNRFQERDPLSDITLVVEEQKLHVQRSLLMMHSPVFQKMLTSDFLQKDLNEISLPGKKYSAMVGLLEQIYPGNGEYLLKDEILADVLEIADEYDIQQAFTNSLQYIARQLRNEYDTPQYTNNNARKYKEMPESYRDIVLYYLGIVERYPQLHALRKRLVNQASRIPVPEMVESEYFLSIPATATRDVLLLKPRKSY